MKKQNQYRTGSRTKRAKDWSNEDFPPDKEFLKRHNNKHERRLARIEIEIALADLDLEAESIRKDNAILLRQMEEDYGLCYPTTPKRVNFLPEDQEEYEADHANLE